jgi:hypothetical protein
MSTAPKKGTFAQLDQRDEVARQSEALARRSLNALAVTSNIVNALVQHPGPGSDHESMVQAAKTMLSQADEMSSRLITRLDLESVSWARYRLMRMTTEAVSNRWMSTARDGGQPSADISAFLPVWREMAKHDLPTFQFEEVSDDERVMMQISVLDAMQPVLQEITAFDLFHDPSKAAMHAREQIVSAANFAVAELLPENTSKRAHGQLLQALLRNAGGVYASNWRRCAQDVVDFLSPLSVERQEQEVAARPGGWPLDGIDKGFIETYAKLTDMVAYLSQPAAGLDSQAESKLVAAQPEPIIAAQSHLMDAIDGTEEMNDYPDWDDEGPDMPDDPAFGATSNMVEPPWDRRLDAENQQSRRVSS